MYIEPVNEYYTDWILLKNQGAELGTKIYDLTDLWQFKNALFHKRVKYLKIRKSFIFLNNF
jgi:homospermidine synthase